MAACHGLRRCEVDGKWLVTMGIGKDLFDGITEHKEAMTATTEDPLERPKHRTIQAQTFATQFLVNKKRQAYCPAFL